MHIIQHRRSWSDYGTRQIPLNPLNAELIPICHLLVLLGAHPVPHISRIRVNGSASPVGVHKTAIHEVCYLSDEAFVLD